MSVNACNNFNPKISNLISGMRGFLMPLRQFERFFFMWYCICDVWSCIECGLFVCFNWITGFRNLPLPISENLQIKQFPTLSRSVQACYFNFILSKPWFFCQHFSGSVNKAVSIHCYVPIKCVCLFWLSHNSKFSIESIPD